MSGFLCPYCSMVMADCPNTLSEKTIRFLDSGDGDCIVLRWHRCSNCGKATIEVTGGYGEFENVQANIVPSSLAKRFPSYVPKPIRDDYQEACAVVRFSPKASATLSRRCLQGMIHDFWGIKEKSLNAEISALQDRIPAAQWQAIDALRKLGNISAHMEKDVNLIINVDKREAESLLRLIELLIDKWYIARHDEEKLLADIVRASDRKESSRSALRSRARGQ